MPENGEEIQQSTRGFDPVKGSTFLMRLKEDAHDYRYFNEPDLPPLVLDEVYIDEVRKKLPALPRQLVEKYTSEFGLSKYDALVLTDDKAIAEYFEELARICSDYKLAANWVMGPVKAYLNEHAIELSQFPLKVRRLAELVSLVQEGKINHSTANQNCFQP